MTQIPTSIASFLDSKHIAVVGVSRNKSEPSNAIFEKMKEAGLPVVPINPHMTTFHGSTCYPDLSSVPDRPDAVFIATHPGVSPAIVRECGKLGITKVWFHRSIGDGSWSAEASKVCRTNGIEPIEGGCPMMFIEPVDIAHRCMRWFFQRTGKVPRPA